MNRQCQYLIERRRNAAIGRIRGKLEAEISDHEVVQAVMQKVAAEVEDLAGIALGLLDAVDEGVEFNELVLEGVAAGWASAVARRGGIPA